MSRAGPSYPTPSLRRYCSRIAFLVLLSWCEQCRLLPPPRMGISDLEVIAGFPRGQTFTLRYEGPSEGHFPPMAPAVRTASASC